MSKKSICLVLISLCAGFVACATVLTTTPERVGPETPKAELRTYLKQHVVQKQAYWRGFAEVPLLERFREPSEEILDYIRVDNLVWGLQQVPADPRLDSSFKNDLIGALESLPNQVRALLQSSLMAIYVVKDLGSSAYGEIVKDEKGKAVGGFIILDRDVLDQPANDWATWKENDPFKQSEGVNIRVTIEEEESNTRLNAIRFILLHEIGHVIAGTHTAPIYPCCGDFPTEEDAEKFPYYRESWFARDKKYVSKFDETFRERPQVRFYMGADTKLSATKAPAIYRSLASTNFPSLYGATAPYDDFAEGLATYVHTVLDGRPYKVEVTTPEDTVVFTDCWRRPDCASKRRLLETILQIVP